MKKLVILTSLIAIIGISNAQDAKKIRVGLTGTAAGSWLKPNMSADYLYEGKSGFTWSGGIATEFRLFNSNNYAFCTGINILQFSGRLSFPDVVDLSAVNVQSTNTAKYSSQYIDIPLTIKMKTNEIGYLTYYGQVGVGAGVKFKAKGENKHEYNIGGETKTLNEEITDINKQTNLFRIPLIVGAGVEYNLSGNTSIVMGVQFNNGFSNYFSWGSGNPMVYETDGKNVLLVNGEPQKLDQKRFAISNFVGFNLGLFF